MPSTRYRLVARHGYSFADAAPIGVHAGTGPTASDALVIKLSSKHKLAAGDRIELLGERVRVLRGFDPADVAKVIFPTVVCESAQVARMCMCALEPLERSTAIAW